MQKILSKVLSTFTVLSMLIMPLASMPSRAYAVVPPPIVWPTSWTTPAQCSIDVVNDESPSDSDLFGTLASPAVGFASDINYQYFREKVDGNPGTATNPNQKAWVVLFQKTLPQYQFLGSVNGHADEVQLWQNTTPAGAVDFSPLLNDPAETLLWEGASSSYAKVTAVGSDYFMDWAIPVSVLISNGITTGTTKYFATSANANNFNKDHLNCYEAIADLSITKTDSPDPVSMNGVLTYTLTVTNSGPDTASNVIISDTLPAGFSLTSVTPGAGVTCSDTTAPTIQCEMVSLSLSSATVTIVGTAVSGTTLSNTATVTATTLDNNTSNNSDTEETTVTPAPIMPKLTVTKVVVLDNGGTKVISDFPLFVDATSVVSGAQNEFNIGAHTISETIDAGYTSVISGDCAVDGTITLASGDVKSCTITNNDKPGTLIVQKVLPNDNGGTAEAEDFSFHINGGPSISFEADGQNDLTVNAALFTITESSPEGYTTTYDNCTDVAVANGETEICIITNDDQPASLTVIKLVENDDSRGTSEAEDFNLFVGATEVISGVAQFFNAGTYTVTEQGETLGDYNSAFTAGDCDSEDGSITLALGETKTCTITNNDKEPGVLHVIKNVENDNPEGYTGTASPEDFTISVSGGNPTPPSFDGSEVGTDVIIDAGASFSVSETDGPLDGYGMEMEGTCSGVMPESGELTCTITNNDNFPTTGGLTVVKVVMNDNGGTKVISNFPLYVTDELQAVTNVTSGENNQFTAGNYVISEDSDANYTSTFSESCSGGNITLENGVSKTCTITNDDKAPTLTLVKVVVNDNGGTLEESEVTLTASGPTGFSGFGPTVSNGESFDAGTYTLSETSGLTGYTASSWSCSGIENDGNQVTLSLNENATCTITNNDNAPSLTLTKIVDDELGGNANPSDWTLTATGLTTISDEGSVSSGDDFDAGTYILSESTGPANYNPASMWQCNGGTLNEAGNQITLALGQEATCTITNTYTPVVYQCSDNGDNGDEEDNLSDENDPGCHTDRDVNNSYSYVPTDDSESNVATECSDGINNNDVDSLVDSNDPACHTDGDPTDEDEVNSYDPDDTDEATECSDDADNSDGEDSLSDSSDPGCHSDGNADNSQSYNPNDTSESNDALPQCSDYVNNNDNDGLVDALDPECHTDGNENNEDSYNPSDDNEDEEGGGGGSSGGSRRPQGQVLGAATEICNVVDTYMRRGYRNVADEVQTLQNFLNGYMQSGLVVDSMFGPMTETAVKAFQLRQKDRVMTPWGLTAPTGIFYKTSLAEAKRLMCPDEFGNLPIPTDLIPWSNNPGAVPPLLN